MSNFLSGGSAEVSPEKLRLLAKVASNKYLSDKAPLNTSIQKLAEENGLNPHQVARVAEMANHETHAALWNSEADKTKVAFDVADPKKITTKEPKASGPVGARAAGREVPKKVDRGPSTAEMFGVKPGDVHHGMGDLPDKKKVVIIIEKTASEKSIVRDDLIKLAMMNEHEEKNLAKLVKQAYLGHGIKLPDIYAYACSEGYGEVAQEYLPKIAEQLQKETARAELLKIAWKAPEELINFDAPMTIVNGAHPILISLDTLLKYRNDIQQFTGRMSRINDDVTILGERLRELE